jgi:hypothetical protein
MTKLEAVGDGDAAGGLVFEDEGNVAVKTASVGGAFVRFLEHARPGQSATNVGEDNEAIMVQW